MLSIRCLIRAHGTCWVTCTPGQRDGSSSSISSPPTTPPHHQALPRRWPLTLPLCFPYFFHNPLELKGAVFRQFICPCNIFLVGYSSKPHGLVFIGGTDTFLYLKNFFSVIWVLPSCSRYALNLNLENPFLKKPNLKF